MKAIAKGNIMGIRKEADGIVIEADDIQIVEEKEREVRDWDIGIQAGNPFVVLQTISSSVMTKDYCQGSIYKSLILFNLLDLVTEIGKAKDIKQFTLRSVCSSNSIRMQMYDTDTDGGVFITLLTKDDNENIIIKASKSDVFRFAAQLLALCREK
jgi:hypothetical protein